MLTIMASRAAGLGGKSVDGDILNIGQDVLECGGGFRSFTAVQCHKIKTKLQELRRQCPACVTAVKNGAVASVQRGIDPLEWYKRRSLTPETVSSPGRRPSNKPQKQGEPKAREQDAQKAREKWRTCEMVVV